MPRAIALAPARNRRARSARPFPAGFARSARTPQGLRVSARRVMGKRFGQRDVHIGRRNIRQTARARMLGNRRSRIGADDSAPPRTVHARLRRASPENSRRVLPRRSPPTGRGDAGGRRRARQRGVDGPRVADVLRERADMVERHRQAGPRRLSEISPNVGFSPTTPHADAGMRIDPPVSVPIDAHPMPAATAAAEPPLEPPGERVGS